MQQPLPETDGSPETAAGSNAVELASEAPASGDFLEATPASQSGPEIGDGHGAPEASEPANVEVTPQVSNVPPDIESAPPAILVPLLEFGPEARLRPEPNTVTPQSVRLEDHVSDTELDGARIGASEVRAVSVRGHMHRWEGEVRQDAFAFGVSGDRLTLAVSDGVGNASASNVGAAAAVREAAREVLDPQTLVTRSRQAVHDAAIARGLSPRDVSATLIAASVPIEPTRVEGRAVWPVTLWQVGDSPAVRVRAGSWDVLHHPDSATAGSDELTNSAVDALPHSGDAAVWIENFQPEDVLLLVTDGVSNLAAANAEYREALISLFEGRTPSMAELLRVVDATVKSFDDDRTVIALRLVDEGA